MIIPGHSKNSKLTLIILVFLGMFALIYFSPKQVKSPNSEKSLTQATQYFIEEVQGRVILEIGLPTDGFDAEMFLSVFPNLIREDFNGAEVRSDINTDPKLSYTKRPLTTYGMGTFLENVARRANLPIDTTDDIDEIIRFMAEGKTTKYRQMEVEGRYTCLPKKDTRGPVTLECALGLDGDDGKFYGMDLKILETMFDPNTAIGTKMRVTGSLVPVEELSNENWHTYDIEGIIWVTSITKL